MYDLLYDLATRMFTHAQRNTACCGGVHFVFRLHFLLCCQLTGKVAYGWSHFVVPGGLGRSWLNGGFCTACYYGMLSVFACDPYCTAARSLHFSAPMTPRGQCRSLQGSRM